MDEVRKKQLEQYEREHCQIQLWLTLPQVWALQTAAERLGISIHEWIHGRLLAELPDEFFERPAIERVIVNLTEEA